VISLKAAVEKCENTKWDSKLIKQHTMKFDEEVFEKNFTKYLEEKWNYWQKTMR